MSKGKRRVQAYKQIKKHQGKMKKVLGSVLINHSLYYYVDMLGNTTPQLFSVQAFNTPYRKNLLEEYQSLGKKSLYNSKMNNKSAIKTEKTDNNSLQQTIILSSNSDESFLSINSLKNNKIKNRNTSKNEIQSRSISKLSIKKEPSENFKKEVKSREGNINIDLPLKIINVGKINVDKNLYCEVI